jgi:hypothetical protein
MKEMIAEGKHVYLYGDRDEAAPLVIINTFQGNGSSIYSALCSMTDKKVNIAVISDINWNNEMHHGNVRLLVKMTSHVQGVQMSIL